MEERWRGGLRARLDVSGDGVIEGWLMRITFEPGTRVRARQDIIGGAVVSPPDGDHLLLQARLASGLGTVYLSLDFASGEQRDVGGATGNGEDAAEAAPLRIECVRAPHEPAHAVEDESWRAAARTDYAWMAKEFNRQYMNSHGKEHDDYQPHSVAKDLQLHYTNGRLWCFFGAVSNATRSLEAATQIDPNHVHSHLLLAKIRIGQGNYAKALAALDEAARVQPDHWQTHLMRLHCLRARGELHEKAAVKSHRNVCRHLRSACKDAKMLEAFPLLCDEGGTRVRLLSDAADTATAGDSDVVADETPAPAGRGLYGWHLHSAAMRRKLKHDRYVVLRELLPRPIIALLQGWYRALYQRTDLTAVFQPKTQRHEYLPEVVSTYLNLALVPFASAMAGMVVAPTYPFPITYIPGGSIHPHLDVSDNELSITFQVELHDPPPQGWPLWFLDPRGQELSNLNASTAKSVRLDNNDGILYYGPDIVHWRNPEPMKLTQIVFAFREEDPAHCNNQ